MSRTRKDGRRGGAHKASRGMEWGSKRGPLGWKDAGPWMKRLTHRMERRVGRIITRVVRGFNYPAQAFTDAEIRPSSEGPRPWGPRERDRHE